MKILLADDERTIAVTLGDALRGEGHEVTVVADGEQALRALEAEVFDCVITDIRMPKVDGLAVTKRAREAHPQAAVFVTTAYGSFDLGFQLRGDGVKGVFQKPFFNEEVILRLRALEEERRLRQENQRLKNEIVGQRFGRLIGTSVPMRAVYEQIASIASSECSVLIEGENGTGKELVAQQVHYNSPRRQAPMEVISVASTPESLIDDVLFGHVKGAFTDARADRPGKFESAQSGSIFIDDIDDMPLQTQVKLLRVLQERQIERIGDSKPIRVDVRIIVATKANLWHLVQEGKFREDLFHRLNVAHIRVPPLRERAGDIPLLVAHFIEKYGKGRPYGVTPEGIEALEKYSWPGNVRELEHSVERAIAYAGGENMLRHEHLLKPLTLPGSEVPFAGRLSTLEETRREAEVRHIRAVLAYTKGHKGEAARILGITRKNLWEKMREYGL
ncbi:MAG: sigma-54-dependent Fis family transcriptional regulator [Planctomycetes bacterium]|nr:sigma-54-dependent Fis family transcriptional regulator [Planctomycetota bacterium]